MNDAVSLLCSADPPPVELFNESGRAPVLLVCDHASRAVPRCLDRLGLDDAVLMRHIGWDIGAAEVTRHLGRRFDAPGVLSGYSRLVVDCNRRPDDPSSIPAVSDGVAVPGNRDLCAAAVAARRAACFDPYHAAVARRLDRFAAGGHVPAFLSIHSCTPIMKGFERPWHIGVLYDADTRIALPLMRALQQRGDVCVGDNQPYSGRTHSGYSVDAHAGAMGLPHVMVEIRQDLIDTHKGAAHWADVLGDALAPILADPGLYRKHAPMDSKGP